MLTSNEIVLFEVVTTDDDSDQLYPYEVCWENTGKLAADGENQVAEIVYWADHPENINLDHIAHLLDLDRCVVSYRQLYHHASDAMLAAIEASNYECAVSQYDGYETVVERNEETGGWTLKVRVMDMPPHSTSQFATQQELAAYVDRGELAGVASEQWYPVGENGEVLTDVVSH